MLFTILTSDFYVHQNYRPHIHMLAFGQIQRRMQGYHYDKIKPVKSQDAS